MLSQPSRGNDDFHPPHPLGELLLILQNPAWTSPLLSLQAAIPDLGSHSPLIPENHRTPPQPSGCQSLHRTKIATGSSLCPQKPAWGLGHPQLAFIKVRGHEGGGLVLEVVGVETLAEVQKRSKGCAPSPLLGPQLLIRVPSAEIDMRLNNV